MKKPSKTTLKKDGNSVEILGVRINSTELAEVLKKINQRIDHGLKTFVVTPNPEFLVYTQEHPWFKSILNQADLAIPDGIGLIWASRFLASRSLKRISGTDLMEKLCALAVKKGWSVYLLGGASSVALKSLTALKNRYLGLNGWAESGPKLNLLPITYYLSPKQEIARVVRRINLRKPDFLFIAFGMGKQEKFIWDNWDKLNVKLAMGVGGAFDYLSSQVPRAPKWIQKIGFEWLYRLIQEPWRWRRQLALLKFIFLVFKQKLSNNLFVI
jgi:N-acetylglucosaminyldiphosphoundecaprenol N-acetyl-beta-D-mannosaminyltransferase